jgi:hypothetical protein
MVVNRETNPQTFEEAIELAEMWDQAADNETTDEREYHWFRARAARLRELAVSLPRRAQSAQDN